jgi:hypothetical protein
VTSLRPRQHARPFYWQIQLGSWPSPSVRLQKQLCETPPELYEQVSPMFGHDQKPSSTTTAGHCPFGPGPCGIAAPSGVCAAAMICSGVPRVVLVPMLGGVLADVLVDVLVLVPAVLTARRCRARSASLAAGCALASSMPPHPIAPSVSAPNKTTQENLLAFMWHLDLSWRPPIGHRKGLQSRCRPLADHTARRAPRT